MTKLKPTCKYVGKPKRQTLCLCPQVREWTSYTAFYVTHQTHTQHNIFTYQNWLQQLHRLSLHLPTLDNQCYSFDKKLPKHKINKAQVNLTEKLSWLKDGGQQQFKEDLPRGDWERRQLLWPEIERDCAAGKMQEPSLQRRENFFCLVDLNVELGACWCLCCVWWQR